MISPVPGGLIAAPRRWDFLASLMLEQKYTSFVEVGCKEGRTTGHILKTVPEARVVAIDPWQKMERDPDPLRETYELWDFEKIERDFDNNVGEHRHRCVMMRETSKRAAYLLQGEFDLVFIDAMHDFVSVDEDITLWLPKVRKGGILAFHDFNHKWPSVERAIAKHFNLMDVGVGFDSVAFVIKQ